MDGRLRRRMSSAWKKAGCRSMTGPRFTIALTLTMSRRRLRTSGILVLMHLEVEREKAGPERRQDWIFQRPDAVGPQGP